MVCCWQIYLYNAATYVLRCKCDKHSGPLKAVDFSQDSTMLQSDGLDYEHNYCKLTHLLLSG